MLYLQQEVWSKLAGLSVRKTPLLFVKSVQGGGHLIHSNPVLITSRYKPSIMLNLVLLLIHSNFYSGERCSRSLGNFSTLTLHFAIISDFLEVIISLTSHFIALSASLRNRVFFRTNLPPPLFISSSCSWPSPPTPLPCPHFSTHGVRTQPYRGDECVTTYHFSHSGYSWHSQSLLSSR